MGRLRRLGFTEKLKTSFGRSFQKRANRVQRPFEETSYHPGQQHGAHYAGKRYCTPLHVDAPPRARLALFDDAIGRRSRTRVSSRRAPLVFSGSRSRRRLAEQGRDIDRFARPHAAPRALRPHDLANYAGTTVPNFDETALCRRRFAHQHEAARRYVRNGDVGPSMIGMKPGLERDGLSGISKLQHPRMPPRFR